MNQHENPDGIISEDPNFWDIHSVNETTDIQKCSATKIFNPAEDMAVDPNFWDSSYSLSGINQDTSEQSPNPPGIIGVKWWMPLIENDGKKADTNKCLSGAPVAPTKHPPDPPWIIGVKGWMPLLENDETWVFQHNINEWIVRRHSYFPRQYKYMVLWRTIATAYVNITSIMVHMVVWMAIWMLLKDFG